MKRIIVTLLMLLISAPVFAQIVSPGGGTALQNVQGGSCTGGQFVTGIQPPNATPICATPAGGGGYPAGVPPQIAGFSATNAAESETLSGDATLTRAGANSYTIAVTKLAGITPGGSCTSPQFVQTISASGVPTCATPTGGGGGITSITAGTGLTGGTITTTGTIALGANPAGGALNFAPIASPTFTGTVTMPDSSTITSAGINNSQGLGIGTTAPAGYIQIITNQNANTPGVQVTNNNAGNAAQASSNFSNGTHVGAFGLVGTGYSSFGTTIPADSFYFLSGGVGGMEFIGGDTVPHPISFVNSASGTPIQIAQFFNGLTVGSPTGGDKGVGTINVSGNFYVNGVAVSAGGGGVTSITAGAGLTGGVITTTGTIALSTPVSIANGGTNNSTAPTAGQILIAPGTNSYTPHTVSGDCTLGAGGAITCTKVNGVSGPFAPLTNPAGGQNNYAALAGVTNGSAAAAGQIGEAVELNGISSSANIPFVATGGAGTWTNIGSITLTAGDWDISAYSQFNALSTTGPCIVLVQLSTTTVVSGSIGQTGMAPIQTAMTYGAADIPAFRYSTSTSTTVYLLSLGWSSTVADQTGKHANSVVQWIHARRMY